jgi:hypothetical protein
MRPNAVARDDRGRAARRGEESLRVRTEPVPVERDPASITVGALYL